MRPFFSFFGAKWRLSLRYPKPLHGEIVEPFAGSAGYALRHGAGRRVTLVDLDPVICGVWRYLVRVSEREILSLPDVREHVSEMADFPQEARWLAGFWLNKGMTAPCLTPGAWARSGVRPGAVWGTRVRERIASQLQAIRHWRIIEGPYWNAPDEPATWLIDPPYVLAGHRYRFGSRGLDYAALAEWCRERRGQTIVCEGPGAHWLDFEPLGDFKTARAKRADEYVWLGG